MSDEDRRPITYRDAGVDTAEGARAVDRIRDARALHLPRRGHRRHRRLRRAVLGGGVQGHGRARAGLRHRRRGHQAQARAAARQHDTVGIDLVAMCANDILVTGAEPLFFLDYVAIGKLDSELVAAIVAGIAEGCRQAGCALVGGEMAEHPGVMDADDYDLSGFCVGVVDRPKMIDGSDVEPGDVVLGLASSGLHSNGFSLVRRVLVDGREAELDCRASTSAARRSARRCSRRRASTCSRCSSCCARARRSRRWRTSPAAASPRTSTACCPQDCDAVIVRGSWPVPRVFETVVEAAALGEDEAYRTFNMGIGFMLVLDARRRAGRGGRAARRRASRSSRSARSSRASGKVVYR